MGGVGSGRRSSSHRRFAEAVPSIDANVLQREGRLRPGVSTVALLQPGAEDVCVLADDDSVRLSRSIATQDGAEHLRQGVGLLRRPCKFGGARSYFVCSGVGTGKRCGRSVVKLYATNRYFVCRHCLGLVYASQYEDGWLRAKRRARKARGRIAHSGGNDAALPASKPKHMHRRTFAALTAAAQCATADADWFLISHFLKIEAGMERQRDRLDP